MAYTTDEEIKVILGISGTAQDAIIARMNVAMENLFDTLIGVDSLDYTEYTEELVQGLDDRRFDVKNSPVVSISAIVDFGSDLAYTGWSVEKTIGRSVYLDKSHGLADVEYIVDYIAGYVRSPDVLPEEVKVCIAYMVAGAISERAKNPGIAEYDILGKSVTFRNGAEYSASLDVINQYAAKFKKSKIRGI